MPNTIQNWINVKGNQQDVSRFEQYLLSQIHETPHGRRIAEFGSDVEITGENDEGTWLEFIMETGRSPNTEWINLTRTQFPMLQFTVFWADKDDVPDYGFIDENGREYTLGGGMEGQVKTLKIMDQYDKIQEQFIPLDYIQPLLQNGYITRWEIDPSLQIWAVPDGTLPGLRISLNNPIKIMTFYGKEGQIYHVKARYDPSTNQIFPV